MPLYFGVFVSLFAYLIGMELKKKFGWPVLNPLLVAIILVIAFLKATGSPTRIIMRERPISAIF